MAEGKDSFLLYKDMINVVRKMKPEDAGELLMHILSYVNDENPETENFIVSIAFEPIKSHLKRDLKKWTSTIDEKSRSGIIGNLKRWHVDLHERFSKNELSLEEALKIANNRKESHSYNCDRTVSQDIANIAVLVPVLDPVLVPEKNIYSDEEFLKNEIKQDNHWIVVRNQLAGKFHSDRHLEQMLLEYCKLFKNNEFTDSKHRRNSFILWVRNKKEESKKQDFSQESPRKATLNYFKDE